MAKLAIDLGGLTENERIGVLGRSVMNVPVSSTQKPTMDAFFVDTPAKADRYIRKLKKKFPGIRIIETKRVSADSAVMMVSIAGPLNKTS